MKDSKTYGQRTSKLFHSLKQKYPKIKKVKFDDPARTTVYAIVSERTRASTAKAILRRIERHFVDLNDLRVSRTEEILEVLGASGENSRKTASLLTQALNSIYNKYNMVSLAQLLDVGKRQARKQLEKLGGLSSFVINYCVLVAFGGHAIPLTEKMIGYLRAGELVHPDATEDEIVGFLERQINASDAYEFYSLLRQESEKARRPRASSKKVEKTAEEADEKTAGKDG